MVCHLVNVHGIHGSGRCVTRTNLALPWQPYVSLFLKHSLIFEKFIENQYWHLFVSILHLLPFDCLVNNDHIELSKYMLKRSNIAELFTICVTGVALILLTSHCKYPDPVMYNLSIAWLFHILLKQGLF